MSSDLLYDGREQSFVKHLILRNYLERFAYIIGSWSDSITYIDCFSGPWESRSEVHDDTSFGIAIQELRKARDELKSQRNRELVLRCCFIEDDAKAFVKLAKFAETINDVDIKTHNGKLEDSIGEIVTFVRMAARTTFAFVFVDPKGWTGFALDVIKPLLTLQRSEVLINFMTEHIRRFIESSDESIQPGFVQLFGDTSFREMLNGLSGIDRDDACVEKYLSVVKKAGGFQYASCAVVLKSQTDRSHFHLLYLTRDAKGIEVFKAAEQKSMAQMEAVRASAQQKIRVLKSGGQRELFTAEESHDSSYFESLRSRYCSRAKANLEGQLRCLGRVTYDEAWASALRLPLVWESDVKKWISDWVACGSVRVDGLAPKARVPKRNSNHVVIWLNRSDR